MQVIDVIAGVVMAGAALSAGVMLLRRGKVGICGRCGYDFSGLPAEVTHCPECAGRRSKRWWRWRRVLRRKFAALVGVMVVALVVVGWPRRDAVMDRMPSWVLLGAERMGYARGLEVLALRAHAGVMMGWSDNAFVDRVTERVMQDSSSVTCPRSNALYVYMQLAMVGDEGARAGLKDVFRGRSAAATDDVLRTLELIRGDVPGAIVEEARQRNITLQALTGSDRGKLYELMRGEPAWLHETMLEILEGAKSDTEAVGTVLVMRELFRDEAYAGRVAVWLAGTKWTAAQSAAETWWSWQRMMRAPIRY